MAVKTRRRRSQAPSLPGIDSQRRTLNGYSATNWTLAQAGPSRTRPQSRPAMGAPATLGGAAASTGSRGASSGAAAGAAAG